VFFGALAEVVFFFSIVALALQVHSVSLSDILSPANTYSLVPTALVVGSMFVVLLTENSRIPVDDPCTHLELTMIHEVMVLDHGGPDLGIIEYGSAVKLWVFSAVLAQLFMPLSSSGGIFLNVVSTVIGIFIISIAIGAVECGMARLKFLHVPRLLVGSAAISVLAIVLVAIGR
ncbi:MAG: NADH-quinone oxidoreductase subunit H, partial [Nitrospinales bacterium]